MNLKQLEKDINKLSVEELENFFFLLDDYETQPVSIEEFVTNLDYLGNSFPINKDIPGNVGFYPYWLDILKQIYPSPVYSPYYIIFLRGAIGRGKSTCANIIMAYEIYRMLCLRNPQQEFSLIPSTRIVFALMNVTLSLSTTVVWDQLNQYFSESKYFSSIIDLNRKMKGKDTLFPKRIDISIGSRIQHGLGQAVFGAMLDEAGFDILNDQVIKNFQSLITRMKSRFMSIDGGGTIPGKLIVISSESEKGSSLTKLAEMYKGKPGVFIDTGPIWEIRPWVYNGETFKVFTGSDSKEPEIITEENKEYYTTDTTDTLDVPIEYKDQFDADIYSNIRDLAGRSTTATYKFIRSRDKLIKSAVVKPIFEDIIRLDFDDINDRIIDKIKVADYFINPIKTKSPRYVHIDIGLTGDRLGIACGSIIDYIEYQSRNNITLENKFESFPKIQIEWCIGIEPTPGKQVPLFKIREFLFTLHELGYRIGKITLDGFQSADFIQIMKTHNYNAELTSVDRTMSPYIQTRDAIYQNRLFMPNNKILIREFSELELDSKKNKVIHPDKNIDGSTGGKDISDAVAGVVFNLTLDSAKYKSISELIGDSTNEQANIKAIMGWK